MPSRSGIGRFLQRRFSVGVMESVEWCFRGVSIWLGTSGNIPANVHSPVIVGSSSRGSITFDSMLRRFMRISKSLMSR